MLYLVYVYKRFIYFSCCITFLSLSFFFQSVHTVSYSVNNTQRGKNCIQTASIVPTFSLLVQNALRTWKLWIYLGSYSLFNSTSLPNFRFSFGKGTRDIFALCSSEHRMSTEGVQKKHRRSTRNGMNKWWKHKKLPEHVEYFLEDNNFQCKHLKNYRNLSLKSSQL